ncbi:MAG: aldehyde dehydrogenase [Cocleimonas sp.]
MKELINKQKIFFQSQQTKDISFRKNALIKLKKELLSKEPEIIEALNKDFKKSEFESVLSETGIVLAELSHTIKKINKWAKPQAVMPSMLNFPSRDHIYKQPFGQVLIIAPWNYPFQLALAPLIGAIAAGNTVVLKPSELTPHTSAIIATVIKNVFTPEHVTTVEGGVDVSQALLAEKWDYIFFTGSVGVGKIIAKAAAENLTPTTLELGGKNPCIIDETANIKLTAKRIVWGKFLNGGQTCIAPDYILIHKSVKDDFISAMGNEITKAYGDNPKASPDFPRIINEENFDRLSDMLVGADCVVGGATDKDDLYIAPTLVNEPELGSDIMLGSEIMKDEIFGPLLPIISYESPAKIDEVISHYASPLSLYVFSKRQAFARQIINRHSFGGGAINDTLIQFANPKLPFGGVGNSGMGAYHGKRSFDTFTHQKSITKHASWLDIPFRYAPYKGKTGLIRFMIKWLG